MIIVLQARWMYASDVSMQITWTLAFAAACASAGITVLIGNDLNKCAAPGSRLPQQWPSLAGSPCPRRF
ncbi:hypothetical protein V6N12_027105 [Hibiscus sabdariffa]|uniref:CASP-like protein n=1 Tax=Hibiscus sabdariffa TaxID=183260 RepID=A0ABR2DUV8_9ROSI